MQRHTIDTKNDVKRFYKEAGSDVLQSVPQKINTEETGFYNKLTSNIKQLTVVAITTVILAFPAFGKTQDKISNKPLVRERPSETEEVMSFSMENIDDIIGQWCGSFWADPDSMYGEEWRQLGLFYTDFSGDTLEFPSDSSITLYSTDGDTIITMYKERITAGPELCFTTGWDVSFKGVKGTQLEIEDRSPTETKTFHGDSTNVYWIESKEIEYGYDWTDTVSIESDYYPLGDDVSSIIFYSGEISNPETYREIDIYGPPIIWEFDTTTLDISDIDRNIPKEADLRLYPNPTNKAEFNLIIKNRDTSIPIRVFDMLGREVPNTRYDRQETTGTLKMSIENLPSGAYSIVWVEEEKGIHKQKTETLIITK